MQIRGGKPQAFSVVESRRLRRIYAAVGRLETVPTGQILVIPEANGWGCDPVLREFPAGTRFRLIQDGDPHRVSITEIY